MVNVNVLYFYSTMTQSAFTLQFLHSSCHSYGGGRDYLTGCHLLILSDNHSHTHSQSDDTAVGEIVQQTIYVYFSGKKQQRLGDMQQPLHSVSKAVTGFRYVHESVPTSLVNLFMVYRKPQKGLRPENLSESSFYPPVPPLPPFFSLSQC